MIDVHPRCLALSMPARQVRGGLRLLRENMMLYYEDLEPGTFDVSPSETVRREDMIAFAKRWDPLPIHVDEAIATKLFGSLTAPGLFILGIKLLFIHKSTPVAVITSFGYDEVRFHQPVRPDDTLVLERKWVSRKLSKSRPDRGIVVAHYALKNQTGATVMSHLDSLLIERRRSVGERA